MSRYVLRVAHTDRMSTDADYYQDQLLLHPDDVIYDVVDVKEMSNLTDWQLAALTGLDFNGQQCLIESWSNSSFSRESMLSVLFHRKRL